MHIQPFDTRVGIDCHSRKTATQDVVEGGDVFFALVKYPRFISLTQICFTILNFNGELTMTTSKVNVQLVWCRSHVTP